MKSLTSWLLVMFMAMFWGFRIIVTIFAQVGGSFGGFIVFDNTIEIVLLFVSIACFALILRRNLIGALIYLLSYGLYFGKYLYETAFPFLMSGNPMDTVTLQNSFVAVLGIFIGLCVVLNIAFEKRTKDHYSDNKTDWFFDNKDYDRVLDDRADKNQYKF